MTCPASNAIRYNRKIQQQSRKERESKGIANFIAATVEITETTANLPVEEEILLSARHGRQPAKVNWVKGTYQHTRPFLIYVSFWIIFMFLMTLFGFLIVFDVICLEISDWSTFSNPNDCVVIL